MTLVCHHERNSCARGQKGSANGGAPRPRQSSVPRGAAGGAVCCVVLAGAVHLQVDRAALVLVHLAESAGDRFVVELLPQIFAQHLHLVHVELAAAVLVHLPEQLLDGLIRGIIVGIGCFQRRRRRLQLLLLLLQHRHAEGGSRSAPRRVELRGPGGRPHVDRENLVWGGHDWFFGQSDLL